jgi:hypothetical protein
MTGAAGRLARRRDLIAGGLLILVGVGIVMKATSYSMGTLMRMGPGFMPTLLGAVIAVLGCVLFIAALGAVEHAGEGFLPRQREWRAWALIVLSPFCFILCGTFFGMAPAIFATVFVASLADRTTTIRNAIALSVLVTLVGVVLFSYLLRIPMQIVTWRGV